MTIDPMWIIQFLIAGLTGILAWNFKKVEATAEATEKELLAYKTYVAQTYVTDNQLTKSLEALNHNIQTVLETVNKIEDRLYKKEQQ